ncbi:MAG: hypothetical protein JW984_15120 [Deltaproteobacteria bacterium]|uniref:Uncharacterized protein n=1 Tax=Candidatus Zymogenus saltonus TaxID=2844893 RepID=A0A9D8KJQ9_9DELT|nr:hypothetical protein [Candidatus Zymogenus saltonus]
MTQSRSQKTKIISYLAYKRGEGATAMELIKESGSTNIRARISELRDEHVNIVNMKPKKLKECGIESKYNLYFIGEFAPKPKEKDAEDAA